MCWCMLMMSNRCLCACMYVVRFLFSRQHDAFLDCTTLSALSTTSHADTAPISPSYCSFSLATISLSLAPISFTRLVCVSLNMSLLLFSFVHFSSLPLQENKVLIPSLPMLSSSLELKFILCVTSVFTIHSPTHISCFFALSLLCFVILYSESSAPCIVEDILLFSSHS